MLEYIANIDFDHKDNAAPTIVLRSQQRHWVGERKENLTHVHVGLQLS